MAHFSLFVFLAFLQGVCPVSAQIISIQDTNVNVIGLYVDGLKVITQRCPGAKETFADYSTSGHKLGFCAPKTQGVITPDPDKYAFVECDSQARVKAQDGTLSECGPDRKCDTITLYHNYIKVTYTLWVSCFNTVDITARTLFQYIATPSATVPAEITSSPDSLTWTNAVSATIPTAPPTDVGSPSHAASKPSSIPSSIPSSTSSSTSSSTHSSTPSSTIEPDEKSANTSSRNQMREHGMIIIGVLVPTFLLIICGLVFYIVSLQKSRKDAREAEETRQYLEDLNNLDLDEDLHEMPAELEMFNVSKTPTTLSSAGCRKSFDSTTEEPTNLSSYSTLVYGN